MILHEYEAKTELNLSDKIVHHPLKNTVKKENKMTVISIFLVISGFFSAVGTGVLMSSGETGRGSNIVSLVFSLCLIFSGIYILCGIF